MERTVQFWRSTNDVEMCFGSGFPLTSLVELGRYLDVDGAVRRQQTVYQLSGGRRDAGWAKEFKEDCASRIKGRVQVTTDGHRAYLEAVEGAFGMDCDYAMLQEIYGAPTGEEQHRHSPGCCIGCDMKVVSGNPDPKRVSTSYIERHNLTMRRFTRLTNAFSKKIENHAAMVAIHAVHYNSARIHKTLRITPSMAAGLSDYVWSLEEIALLAN